MASPSEAIWSQPTRCGKVRAEPMGKTPRAERLVGPGRSEQRAVVNRLPNRPHPGVARSMRKPVPIFIVILIAAVGWIFFKNFRVTGFTNVKVVPRQGAASVSPPTTEATLTRVPQSSATTIVEAPAAATNTTPPDRLPHLRVATFNAQALDTTKSRKPQVLDILARIGRQFDVLALQDIQSETNDILPRLIHTMNQTGKKYDYAISPRIGPTDARQQYAFVFNTQTVALDRNELYTVDDRDDLLTYEPFVGWFRALGPKPEEAFTFSVINVRLNPETALQEREYLANLMFAVRDDGRREDDVLLAGDLRAGVGQLGSLDRLNDATFAVANTPTDVAGQMAWDNLVFFKGPTEEFTGDAGVFDFLRVYNLDLERAMEVSEHLPVWADFSIYEGGQPGRVAQIPTGPSATTAR